jgi:transposase
MSQKKHCVTLTAEECQQLQRILDTGRHTAQQRKRAKVLLLAQAGKSDPIIAHEAEVGLSSVYVIRRRYCEEGIQACLTENPRPGRPHAMSGGDEAALTALVCSTPPDGRVCWTHRLLADRLVALELIDNIAHTTVGRLLKKTS